LLVGCANSKNRPQTASTLKPQPQDTAAIPPVKPYVAPASANPTSPTTPPLVAHPLAGAWQLAVPRRPLREAAITATDATHLTISAGKNGFSGNYVQQGSYLLILTNDERLRPLAWKINSNDSLTLVRAPDFGAGASKFLGVTLLRAPDADATTEADLDEMFAE
jgi:hypothetical protein